MLNNIVILLVDRPYPLLSLDDPGVTLAEKEDLNIQAQKGVLSEKEDLIILDSSSSSGQPWYHPSRKGGPDQETVLNR